MAMTCHARINVRRFPSQPMMPASSSLCLVWYVAEGDHGPARTLTPIQRPRSSRPVKALNPAPHQQARGPNPNLWNEKRVAAAIAVSVPSITVGRRSSRRPARRLHGTPTPARRFPGSPEPRVRGRPRRGRPPVYDAGTDLRRNRRPPPPLPS
ncbi:hypothetical protein ZWY2020_045299 [Hordeum vulgare]|nr:hypothetical protein ZWY2020_045299 [Hordeum vulgare]